MLAMAELGEVNGIIYEAGSRSTQDAGFRKETRETISIRAEAEETPEAEQVTKQEVREPRRSAFALHRI